MTRKPIASIEYFLHLKDLVSLEETEEFDQIRDEYTSLSPAERETRGKALLQLKIAELHFSPAGHLLVTFEIEGKKPLPVFSLEIGDMVTLASNPPLSGDLPSGTVYEKTLDSITVAYPEDKPRWVEELEERRSGQARFELHRSINRVTFKRMKETLDGVIQTQNTRLAVFRDISIQEKKAMKYPASSEIRWLDPGLNASQKEAVRKCMEAQDVALVHGPPGTGKTTALIEIVRQSLLRKQSVFVTAPSNTACDNLLERLVEKNVNALRLGHPARVSGDLREHTLDFKLARHPLSSQLKRAEAEMQRLKARLNRYYDRRSPGVESEKELKTDISLLRQDVRSIEKEIFQRVMKEADAIVGTPTSMMDRSIREKMFDLLVMDEATQATEPMSWIPMTGAKKVIMAGDHFQLPPTVRSDEALRQGLGLTLFERYYDILGPEFKQLLDRQYRMNEIIMGFSSQIFYENKLIADESVKNQTLSELRGVREDAETRSPLVFIDTAGKGFEEKLEEGSDSRYNAEEAALVISELKKLLEDGVPASETAVISPYSAQVRLLTRQLSMPDLEIDSVDGFQGREKELVIVSLVRSNLEGELGFLTDTRRMNVAMTRARRKLIVIGDSATLSSLDFYKKFIEYADRVGGYKTAWELE